MAKRRELNSGKLGRRKGRPSNEPGSHGKRARFSFGADYSAKGTIETERGIFDSGNGFYSSHATVFESKNSNVVGADEKYGFFSKDESGMQYSLDYKAFFTGVRLPTTGASKTAKDYRKAVVSVQLSSSEHLETGEIKESLLSIARKKQTHSFLQGLISEQQKKTGLTPSQQYLAFKARQREGK